MTDNPNKEPEQDLLAEYTIEELLTEIQDRKTVTTMVFVYCLEEKEKEMHFYLKGALWERMGLVEGCKQFLIKTYHDANHDDDEEDE